jgi:hypothetical protein
MHSWSSPPLQPHNGVDVYFAWRPLPTDWSMRGPERKERRMSRRKTVLCVPCHTYSVKRDSSCQNAVHTGGGEDGLSVCFPTALHLTPTLSGPRSIFVLPITPHLSTSNRNASFIAIRPNYAIDDLSND